MKANIKIISVFFILMTSCIIYPRQTTAQESNVSFQVFYDQLSPYGQWIDYSDYGYVWIPDAGSDFVPYSTDGHWILTDYGWTWASDYSWGWATFHYGRWDYNDSFGWFWVPDNEWGPAWVNWRQSDGYYGWSPMEPGMSVSMSFDRQYDNHNDHWMFVRSMDIERTDVNHYYINRADHQRIARNSVVINNTYVDNNRHTTYVSGPSRIQVQKVVGRTIHPVVIRENNKPGQVISNGQLRIYRPQVVKNSPNGRKSAPSRVTNMNEVKRTPANNSLNQHSVGNPVNRTIQQPVRTVEPRNNNTAQPVQRRTVTTPDNNVQPASQRTYTPQNNNSKPVKQRVYPPQNNVNQPVQQRNNIPQNNAPQPVQQRNVSPQNNVPQPVQQRNVTPRNNEPQPVQQRDVTPRNKPEQPVQRQNAIPQNNRPQPAQQRNVAPQNNTPQPAQQRNVAPQNNKPEQNTSPVKNGNRQDEKSQNLNQSKNRPAKQQKSVKQQIKTEQAKVPDAVTDKK
jgi:hypothetical protein